MVQEPPYFRLEQRVAPGDVVLLAFVGELDMLSAGDLVASLDEVARHRRHVLIDLSRLQFIDVSGLRAVLTALAGARREGRELEVSSDVPAPVGRMIELAHAREFIWPTRVGG